MTFSSGFVFLEILERPVVEPCLECDGFACQKGMMGCADRCDAKLITREARRFLVYSTRVRDVRGAFSPRARGDRMSLAVSAVCLFQLLLALATKNNVATRPTVHTVERGR